MLININSKSTKRSLLTEQSTTQGWLIAALIAVLMVGIGAYGDYSGDTKTTISKPNSRTDHTIDRKDHPAERVNLGEVVAVYNLSALRANTDNHTIEWVEPYNGTVTTLAGEAGIPGSSDGPGAKARFRNPASAAMSADGTFILVADTGNHTIRRIDLDTGEVSTLAGLAGQAGSDDGIGVAARFYYPQSVAIDNTGTFALVADSHNHTIRHIELSTRKVTTLAGQAGYDGHTDGVGSEAHFYCPQTVAFSSDGSFALVTDYCNDAIRRIELASGVVMTMAEQSDISKSLLVVK